MIVFLGFYHSLVKTALKQLVALWSSSAEETVRVVAFLCILRITTNQQKSLLDSVLKELSYRKPLPNLRHRSKSSSLVDNVIAESRRRRAACRNQDSGER
ncbi:Nucleolar complex protein 2 [Homalodisca vitripennis]|nr:Nucleolar complex protein 2 [Homalodisca vitripennis]